MELSTPTAVCSSVIVNTSLGTSVTPCDQAEPCGCPLRRIVGSSAEEGVGGLKWIDWVTIGGTILTAFGAYAAFRQGRTAKTIAQSAEKAAAEVARKLGTVQAIEHGHRLDSMSTELIRELRDPPNGSTFANMERWRQESGYLHGILSQMAGAPASFREALTGANAQIAISRKRLEEGDALALESISAIASTQYEFAKWRGRLAGGMELKQE